MPFEKWLCLNQHDYSGKYRKNNTLNFVPISQLNVELHLSAHPVLKNEQFWQQSNIQFFQNTDLMLGWFSIVALRTSMNNYLDECFVGRFYSELKYRALCCVLQARQNVTRARIIRGYYYLRHGEGYVFIVVRCLSVCPSVRPSVCLSVCLSPMVFWLSKAPLLIHSPKCASCQL